ncbi:penicillin-binding protein activator [Parachitinimonas caeni]|uniref:Penicillin-binding protein activator n=1 Tax=Parachitinimonas caeni TaxID=3031301 RepID=A0ABT7DTB4_9NEIS|nr:penicillin-binding protein activator [Parachitinimonas caeni]MDK2123305.1 penicillin-binding protein activator [Parachitinimonas caeni]
MQGLAPFWRTKGSLIGTILAGSLLYGGATAAASAAEASPQAEPPTPHIALLLPIKSKSLGTVAEAIKSGAVAAQAKLAESRTPILRLYPTGEKEEDTVTQYKRALAEGAVGVIGPVTRPAISQIAATGRLDIPVLALNALDDGALSVTNLYGVGLSIESEAREIARLMREDGRSRPAVILTDAPLTKRMQQAFSAEWQIKGGSTTPVVYDAKTVGLAKLKELLNQADADAVFLASDLKKARLVRPYIGNDRPVYATSQIWGGKFGKTAANVDLLGIKFVDMPWLLDPHNPEVAAYASPDKPLSADLSRLYALGIDAYRLSLQLIVAEAGVAIEMQGVTGGLRLDKSREFHRHPVRGEIGGEPLTPPPPASPPAETPAETSASGTTPNPSTAR